MIEKIAFGIIIFLEIVMLSAIAMITDINAAEVQLVNCPSNKTYQTVERNIVWSGHNFFTRIRVYECQIVTHCIGISGASINWQVVPCNNYKWRNK